MTWEEAKKHIVTWFCSLEDYELPPLQVTQALQVVISAHSPISREQVEQACKSKWIQLNNTQEHFCESCGVAFNLYAYCKNDYRFCPACGAPMTDEAVDIIMHRLEALKDAGD